jgi:curved DNA-binding protein CbpA
MLIRSSTKRLLAVTARSAVVPQSIVASPLPSAIARRGLSYDTSSGPDSKALPDYYKVLGLTREATDEEIKKAFRDLAKKHHPDVLAAKLASSKSVDLQQTDVTGKSLQPSPEATAAAHLDYFKLLNEAYSVLSDPLMKKTYDSEKFSRQALLKMRNEGYRGEGGVVQFRRSTTGLTAEELAHMTPDEVFQKGMARAHERAKDNARFRATMARANRAKVGLKQQTKREYSAGSKFESSRYSCSVLFSCRSRCTTRRPRF